MDSGSRVKRGGTNYKELFVVKIALEALANNLNNSQALFTKK